MREFCELAFRTVGLEWEQYVEVDERYLRPTEVDSLQGDASKAARELGWKPRVRFDDLVSMMVESDLVLAERERTLVDAGLMETEWNQ